MPFTFLFPSFHYSTGKRESGQACGKYLILNIRFHVGPDRLSVFWGWGVAGGGRGWQVSDHRQPQWALRVVRPVFLLRAEELSAKPAQNSCSVPRDLNVLIRVDLPPGDRDMALHPWTVCKESGP